MTCKRGVVSDRLRLFGDPRPHSPSPFPSTPPATMSIQVRHFQACSNSFRSSGFNSAAPPLLRTTTTVQQQDQEKEEESSAVGSPPAAPTTTTTHMSWTCSQQYHQHQRQHKHNKPSLPSHAEPEAKRRKPCAIAAGFLDPSLWKFLPEDLMEKVAAYMPFPGVFRCRAVNKRLQEYVFSEKWQEARACLNSWAYLSPKSPYLLVFASIQGQRMCTAYDAAANRWLCMPPMRGLPSRAKDCVAGEKIIQSLHVGYPRLLPTYFPEWHQVLSSIPPFLACHSFSDWASAFEAIQESLYVGYPSLLYIYPAATALWLPEWQFWNARTPSPFISFFLELGIGS